MTPTLKFLATVALTALLLNACATAEVQTADIATENGISFLHLNDTYRVGSVEDGSRGGFGRVTTLIREL